MALCSLPGFLSPMAVPAAGFVAAAAAPDYRITAAGGEFRGTNAAQAFELTFRANGFSITSGSAAEPWSLGLELLGIGRKQTAFRPGVPLARRLVADRLEVDHGAFRMHYTNAPHGMRHDLIVLRKPAGDGPLQARLAISGDMVPVQVDGDRVVFHTADPERGGLVPALDYSGLRVWDADGSPLPAHMVLRDAVLVLEVQDGQAKYPITIDPISSAPNTTLTGLQAGASLGYSVATAGDVNGDGYSDVLVGVPYYDALLTDVGQVMLFLGSATGLSTTPTWTAQGTATNDQFGFSVSSAGDMNGDGYGDVVIGAPSSSGAGKALLYLGGPTGLAASAVRTWSGDGQLGCRFGYSVALVGDVNGDGLSDVAVGAPLYDLASFTDRGKTYVYYGATTLPTGANWIWMGLVANARSGSCVAGAGDLNGDGFSDVAVGAPQQNKSPLNKVGFVHLFKGSSSGLPSAPDRSLSGSSDSGLFGTSVSSAGDTNGDGYADLLVGAPTETTNIGAVFLYKGVSGPTALVSATFDASLTGVAPERLGQSVALAGDLNGDGYADVLVGSPGADSNKGRVRAYRGGPTGLVFDAAHLLWTRNGAVGGDKLGAALCTAGDVNGDGISDVVFGAPGQGGVGQALVYHSAPEMPTPSAPWSVLGGQADAALGYAVSSAGDVNADGYSDVLVGAPGMDNRRGRAMLFLGSASGLSTSPSWTMNGENASDQFGFAVASAGDVNGDGYSDVLVGAPAYPNGTWVGKVQLYLGGPAGLSNTPAWTKTGVALDDRFGFALSSAGDVNGDGYSDVAVGAYMYDDGRGRAYVFHGSASGVATTANWIGEGSPFSFYASSISLAGDVDGDGYDDLIVGAPLHDVGSSINEGAAFVYRGSPSGLSLAPSWSAFGGEDGDEFGCSVSFAGDVNADGYSDVIIGAYRHTVGPNSQAGRAYVYHGSALLGLENTPSTVIDGTQPNAQAGISVCSAGDVNGDGYSDVLIGAHGQSASYLNQGQVWIRTGSPTGLLPGNAWVGGGPATDARLGSSVALAGDVNGDGYSDVVAGALGRTVGFTNEGAALLFLGNNGTGMAMPTFQYRTDRSTPVRTSNGTFETACDWALGHVARNALGRTKVKLVWDHAAHGPGVPVPLSPLLNNNSTAYLGQNGSWYDSGLLGVLIKDGVVGPAGSSHAAWRVRVRHHLATALDGRPFGRWFVQGVHDLQVPSVKTDLLNCGPLPVTLVGARVLCLNGSASVEWTTATEQECTEFRVMRSFDGSSWEVVAHVPCNGNSTRLLDYRAVDDSPAITGVTYYRLDQLESSGEIHSFPVLVLSPCDPEGDVTAWPNPVQDEFHVAWGTVVDDKTPLLAIVRDMAGREVGEFAMELLNGRLGRIRGLHRLPAGSYTVELHSPGRGVLGVVRMARL